MKKVVKIDPRDPTKTVKSNTVKKKRKQLDILNMPSLDFWDNPQETYKGYNWVAVSMHT